LLFAFHEGLRKSNGQLCGGFAKSVTEKNNEGKVREGPFDVSKIKSFIISYFYAAIWVRWSVLLEYPAARL